MFNNNMNLFNQNLQYNYENQNYDELDGEEEDQIIFLNRKTEKKKNKAFKSIKEFESKDLMTQQIFSLSRTSQNKQKLNFKRNKKK